MKKYLLTTIVGIIVFSLSQAQIPNGGFENWEQVDNYEKPLNWSTNQDTFYTRLVRDTISVEGMSSMKLIPSEDIHLHGCESRAATFIEFSSVLPSNSNLTFYVKIVPEDPVQSESVHLRVVVISYDSVTSIGSNVWETFTSIDDFTRIDIPLEGQNIEALQIILYGAGISSPVDGPCQNRSFVWIDGMTINPSTSGDNYLSMVPSIVSIFPNPTSGLMYVNSTIGKCTSYELYSMIGRIISKGKIDNDQFIIHEKGTFVLKLVNEIAGRNTYHSRIIVVD